MRIFLTAGLLACFGAFLPASAGLLYVIDPNGGSNPADLYSIDPGTLAMHLIGNTGQAGEFGSLAYDTANLTMYWAPGVGNGNLYSLNLSTGAPTLVGNLGLGTSMTGMAFDPNNGKMFGYSGNAESLYSINLSTGAATLVGPTATTTGGGLTYNTSSNQMLLLGVDQSFYTMNESTGVGTLVSGPGLTGLNDSGIAYDSAGNVYWVASLLGPLYQYDPNSFARTTEINDIGAISEIAYVGQQGTAPSTPEPSGLAALLLAGCAIALAKRRKGLRSTCMAVARGGR